MNYFVIIYLRILAGVTGGVCLSLMLHGNTSTLVAILAFGCCTPGAVGIVLGTPVLWNRLRSSKRVSWDEFMKDPYVYPRMSLWYIGALNIATLLLTAIFTLPQTM